MPSTKDTVRSLKRQIESQMIRSESGRFFLPDFFLSTIFTLDNVNRAVGELECLPYERIGLVGKIHSEALRLFAILIRCGEEDTIITFREHGVSDSSLPLSEERAIRIAGPFGRSFASDHQWQFLPFRFHKEMSNYPTYIDTRIILPFLEGSQDVAEGGFGDISRVGIFPLLQDFAPNTSEHVQVIRKKIRKQGKQERESYDETFRNEQWCLVLLNQLKHPNIVPLLASYTYGGEHHFLFPAFDMDLESFLQSHAPHGRFESSVTFYSALAGLASALCSTHTLHLEAEKHGIDYSAIGYHHDLRPANVLVSSEAFVLADFGLGRFRSASKEVVSKTPWKVGVGDYLAPECTDENFAHQEVGRGIDVWAFGCLLAEVITYMEAGASGLEEFRESRISQGLHSQWYDSYFYGKEGAIKANVQKHLAKLSKNALAASPITMLAKLSGRTLKGSVEDRPKMVEICNALTFISLKSYFVAIYTMFQGYVNNSIASTDHLSTGMSIWFDKERFNIFCHVLGLHGDEAAHLLDHELLGHHKELQDIMKRLYWEFKYNEGRKTAHQSTEVNDIPDYGSLTRKTFERCVHQLVTSLWSHLPEKEQGKGESTWIRTMLSISENQYRDEVHRNFELDDDDPAYKKGAAIATMQRIRLEMESNPTHLPRDVVLKAEDVQVVRAVKGHNLGYFKSSTPVLVEWMTYSSAWKEIPPHERAVVMGLKAQSFGLEAKPPSLRTLDCIGVFESTGKKEGYGFVYRIDEITTKVDSESSITTLLQLLEMEDNQHFLGLHERFQLAALLANFLEEFHTIGWLHEGFNSNNIMFPRAVVEGGNAQDLAKILEQAHIVGLHKSRPGGESWHTTGDSHQDYQHPEYADTDRYRMSYDYYSLGLMLLEIGFWRPLSFWSTNYQELDLAEIRNKLLENFVPRLTGRMGAVYRDVVRFCLSIESNGYPVNATQSGGSEDISGEDDINFGMVLENIIEPLNRLAKMAL